MNKMVKLNLRNKEIFYWVNEVEEDVFNSQYSIERWNKHFRRIACSFSDRRVPGDAIIAS